MQEVSFSTSEKKSAVNKDNGDDETYSDLEFESDSDEESAPATKKQVEDKADKDMNDNDVKSIKYKQDKKTIARTPVSKVSVLKNDSDDDCLNDSELESDSDDEDSQSSFKSSKPKQSQPENIQNMPSTVNCKDFLGSENDANPVCISIRGLAMD